MWANKEWSVAGESALRLGLVFFSHTAIFFHPGKKRKMSICKNVPPPSPFFGFIYFSWDMTPFLSCRKLYVFFREIVFKHECLLRFHKWSTSVVLICNCRQNDISYSTSFELSLYVASTETPNKFQCGTTWEEILQLWCPLQNTFGAFCEITALLYAALITSGRSLI